MRFSKVSGARSSSEETERWVSEHQAYEIRWCAPPNQSGNITVWSRPYPAQLIATFSGNSDTTATERLVRRLLNELHDQPESMDPADLERFLSMSHINSSTHILIVEDHEGCRRALTYTLEHAGFLVHPFVSAEAAIHDMLHIPIHMAILDWQLPGMCGGLLALELRHHMNELPILFWTAEDNLASRLTSIPGAIVISKTSGTRTLLAAVRQLFRRSD